MTYSCYPSFNISFSNIKIKYMDRRKSKEIEMEGENCNIRNNDTLPSRKA